MGLCYLIMYHIMYNVHIIDRCVPLYYKFGLALILFSAETSLVPECLYLYLSIVIIES